MKISNLFITTLAWIYVIVYKIRENIFGYIVKFDYLPKEISPIKLPVHMDLFWLRKGFLGRNLCLVPKGHPYSYRFNNEDKYYQTWIGTYYIHDFLHNRFKNKKEKVSFLANSAIEDQNEWLRVYGFINPQSKVIKNSIKFIEEINICGFKQSIYYGEMETGIDDSLKNKGDAPFIHLFSIKTGELYSKIKVNYKLLYKDPKPSVEQNVKLFGYFGVLEITPGKYILNYVCGTQFNKNKIEMELLKVIRNVQLLTT